MSVHSHAAAQKSSGAFFSVWDRERCRKSAGRGRNALRASQAVRATDVMVNVKNIYLDKKAFKKNNTATTNFDGPELCT